MKLLIVEDDSSLRELMQRALTEEGYVVETASTFDEADAKVSGYSYDCILLDIMLPGGSGLQLLDHIKHMQKRENVIIISAKDSLDDKVYGLEHGADDYLPKPFHMAELKARIRSVLRRGRTGGNLTIEYGNVTIQPENGYVEVAGTQVELLKKSSIYCCISCSGPTIWWISPSLPRPCGATTPTRPTTTISSTRR